MYARRHLREYRTGCLSVHVRRRIIGNQVRNRRASVRHQAMSKWRELYIEGELRIDLLLQLGHILISCWNILANQKIRAAYEEHHIRRGHHFTLEFLLARTHNTARSRARHAGHELDGQTESTDGRCPHQADGSPEGHQQQRWCRGNDGRLNGHHNRHGVRTGSVSGHRIHLCLCDRLVWTHLRNK